MARVNHRRVRQLLDEKRSKITDRQFFTSHILGGHFEDIAMAQTKRYGFRQRIRVHLYWKPNAPEIAWTDNACITINCGSKMVTQVRGRHDRYVIITGLFAHELGHLLGTDFLVKQTYLNYLEHGKWYPKPLGLKDVEDANKELKFWDYWKESPDNVQLIQQMIAHMENIFEDGYIENLILAKFPGVLGYSLEALRKLQLENMPTVTEMIETEDNEDRPIFASILQNMLSYAKYGQIKYGETPLSDQRIQTVFRLIPEIDSAVLNPDAKERWYTVSRIMIKCWDYVQDYLEYHKSRQEKSDPAAGSQKGMVSLSGATAEGSGSTVPALALKGNTADDASESARNGTRADAVQTQFLDPDESVPEDDTEPDSPAGDDGDDAAEENGGRIPYRQTDSVSEPLGGSITRDEDYEREMNERAASDIEEVLENMAQKAACVQAENERLKELNETAQNISYGNVHAGVAITVHRTADVDDAQKEQYDEISTPLLNISRQLQKSIAKKLADIQRGGKLTGLGMGRRLDAHALCRNDGKIFYKNNLPNEAPSLSVGLLIDESGSMSCSDRSTYARAAAIILYDFCQSLRIPIMIYGHSAEYGSRVDLYSYAEFDAIDRDDRYRLMGIAANNCNRDGAALRYVAEQMSGRTENVRILMLLSDGQPYACGYEGTAAEEDLRGIKQEYRRKGLLFVAAGIGEDKQILERIYGESFMDITDLNELPTKLTAVIKRFLRL